MVQKTVKNSIYDTVTINDLKDRLFEGKPLSESELKAIENFDSYRLRKLQEVENEKEFERIYLLIRAEANLENFSKYIY